MERGSALTTSEKQDNYWIAASWWPLVGAGELISLSESMKLSILILP
jgi:hypothetical protein